MGPIKIMVLLMRWMTGPILMNRHLSSIVREQTQWKSHTTFLWMVEHPKNVRNWAPFSMRQSLVHLGLHLVYKNQHLFSKLLCKRSKWQELSMLSSYESVSATCSRRDEIRRGKRWPLAQMASAQLKNPLEDNLDSSYASLAKYQVT